VSYRAEVLADSIASNVRLITLLVTFPRFILAEFNTHRMFSRNSASSRAIPVEKRIAQVWRTPFVPESFSVNKRGMQADANLGGWKAACARWLWLFASRVCCVIAWLMCKLDVHKQHANRVIELWAWHTVIVTATEWDNFFGQRKHKAAQPEMQITAKCMFDAIEDSDPVTLEPGEWHLPFIEYCVYDRDGDPDNNPERALPIEQQLQISVARCAAVSYERQAVVKPIGEYAARHDQLVSSAHWSPLEHQARVATEDELRKYALYVYTDHGDADVGGFIPAYVGNFRAPWLQGRKTFSNEAVFRG